MAIHKFLAVMRNRRAIEWTDIKELTPLQFMPYVADLFWEVTGKDLQGLSQFTGWIGLEGYYHWKVAQLGLLHAYPHLQGQPVPRGPMARPSGRPYPPRLTQTETPAAGASGRHQDGSQLTPDQGGKSSTSGQGGKSSTSSPGRKPSTSGQGGKSSTSSQGRKTSTPTRAVNQPPQAEVRNQPPQEALLTCPWREKEWVMVPGPTGTKGPSVGPKEEPLSPKGLPI